jgi:FkbM family methyltransferase
MSHVSYAQHGEDILLRRFFPEEAAGFYVDIGANHPTIDSVTKHFYDCGWSGVNVEPVPHLHARLQEERPRDLNLNVGISNREEVLTFFEAPSVTGWSTFSGSLADVYRRRGLRLVERSIPVTTLASLFERYVSRPVDFLKIDVEGHERAVFEGIDWSRCRPRVLVVENSWPDSWMHLIPDSDYVCLHDDPINRYYARRDESALLGSWESTRGQAPAFVPFRARRRWERTLAGLASRDDLGPLSRAVRSLLSITLTWASTRRRRQPRRADFSPTKP